ncbi:hypothetical protein B5M42_006760 [Paenibacillus athensensis]|uniref:hypothetical protein n=1 Tax=Paenibacillus athensensis TaxID=1967502 RepID=UPI0014319202|nr:hypothetical protein [Paenibacillus athensensis]MCD1258533.1 hypothetical protein [Paenibacillus athensensis]
MKSKLPAAGMGFHSLLQPNFLIQFEGENPAAKATANVAPTPYRLSGKFFHNAFSD